jgi:UDP-N-acetylmuramoyl-tripeptide--D-alanyl-D-alanine ligase
VILLKGSVDLHLERIALSWRGTVRCWEPACGHNSGCMDCGRYADPFEWHKGRKKRRRLAHGLMKLLAK